MGRIKKGGAEGGQTLNGPNRRTGFGNSAICAIVESIRRLNAPGGMCLDVESVWRHRRAVSNGNHLTP